MCRRYHFEESVESSDSCHETDVLAYPRTHNFTPKKNVKVHEKPPPPVIPAVPSSRIQHPDVEVCQSSTTSLLPAPPSLVETRVPVPSLADSASASLLHYQSSLERQHLTSHLMSPSTASMVPVPSSNACVGRHDQSSRPERSDMSSPSVVPPAVNSVPEPCVLRTLSTPKRPSAGSVSGKLNVN